MNILSWILFGLIASLISTSLEDNPTTDRIISTVLLGIMGAVLGGLLSSIIFEMEITGFSLESLFVAALGSAFLLYVSRAFRTT